MLRNLRVTILVAGSVVTNAAAFESEFRKSEKEFVLATLRATSQWQYDRTDKWNSLAKNSPGPGMADALGAMLMAAKLNLREAETLLRRLESCPTVSSSVGGPSAYQESLGGIKPSSYENLTVRQFAQLSLRRLGFRPGGYQTTKLYCDSGHWHPKDPLSYRREEWVEKVKAGMIPEEVMEFIGAPDFITRAGWEYDLDGEAPATLILSWGQGGVEKIERQTPPKWREGIERERELVL